MLLSPAQAFPGLVQDVVQLEVMRGPWVHPCVRRTPLVSVVGMQGPAR